METAAKKVFNCFVRSMIRDERMRLLVPDTDESICPFVRHVSSLYIFGCFFCASFHIGFFLFFFCRFKRDGVSSILVMGGSSDYFGAASCVIQMKSYLPVDVTARARALAPPSGELSATVWPPRSQIERRLRSAPSARDERGKLRIKVQARKR